jgi:hypothetical protein
MRLNKNFDQQFESIPEIEEILEHSHGILMWQYQLKKLLELFVSDPKQIDEIVKGISEDVPAYKSRIADYGFPSGFSVADVLDQRMLFGHLEKTNIFGTLALYNYLIMEYF